MNINIKFNHHRKRVNLQFWVFIVVMILSGCDYGNRKKAEANANKAIEFINASDSNGLFPMYKEGLLKNDEVTYFITRVNASKYGGFDLAWFNILPTKYVLVSQIGVSDHYIDQEDSKNAKRVRDLEVYVKGKTQDVKGKYIFTFCDALESEKFCGSAFYLAE